MSEPSLAVVGQGVKRTVLNGVPYDYRAGQYLVVSVDLPVIGQALEASEEEPFAVFTMTLKPAAIAPLLLETVSTTKPPAFSGLAVSNATPELLDPIVRLLRLLDRPDDLRVLAPGLEREILGVWSPATRAHWFARSAWPTAASRISPARSAISASTTTNPC